MRNKPIVVLPNSLASGTDRRAMGMNATSDVVIVLLLAMMSLPLALGACLRYPSLTTLMLVTILCVFSSSTWGHPPQQLLLPPRKRPRHPSAN